MQRPFLIRAATLATLSAAICAQAATTAQQGPDPGVLSQRVLDELAAVNGVPGMGAAVWRGGRIVWRGSTGLSDLAADEARRLLKRFMATWETKAPKLAAWAAEAVPESFAVFAMPTEHRRRLRTSNALERLNKELKRRTRVATLFPNTASCERLASAVAMEISEEWVSGRAYLNMDGDH